MEPDKLLAYRGANWHAHRKAGRLQFYCAIVDCPNKSGEYYLDRRLLNSHRREKHGELQLPDVVLKELNRKTKYSRERYERERNDHRKWLDNLSRSQRWKLEKKACSKEGVTDKSKLSDIAKAEIDEKMAVYDSEENRQKRIRTRDEREEKHSHNPAHEIFIAEEEMLPLETKQVAEIKREEAVSEREEEKLDRERNKVETEEQALEIEAEKGQVNTGDDFGVSNSDLVFGKYEEGLELWESFVDPLNPLNPERCDGQLSLTGKCDLEDSSSTELAPLTMEEEARCNDALTRSNTDKYVVFHKKSNMEITKDDIQCLRPRKWLNSNVVNLYLVLLKERQERQPTRYVNCHFFNTWFYVAILVPINCMNHWSLAAINFRDNKIQYFDSLNKKGDEVYNTLMAFLKDEARKKRWNVDIVDGLQFENVQEIPLQDNSDDCGIYMLLYADFHSRGWKPKFKQEDIPKYRRIMLNDILRLRVRDYFKNEGKQGLALATQEDVLHVDEDSSAGTSRSPPLLHTGLTPTPIRKVKCAQKRKEKKKAWMVDTQCIAKNRQKRL